MQIIIDNWPKPVVMLLLSAVEVVVTRRLKTQPASSRGTFKSGSSQYEAVGIPRLMQLLEMDASRHPVSSLSFSPPHARGEPAGPPGAGRGAVP